MARIRARFSLPGTGRCDPIQTASEPVLRNRSALVEPQRERRAAVAVFGQAAIKDCVQFVWTFVFPLLLCGLLLAGCGGQRGVLEPVPEGTTPETLQNVIVATSRAPVEGPPYYSNRRSYRTSFSVMEVSVPPDRNVGTAPFPPQSGGDPARHFMVDSYTRLAGEQDYLRAIHRQSRAQPGSNRQGAVLVHGYNTNFAEAVVKQAQFMHDLGRIGVNILYSWPSAAKIRDYATDQESTLFARDSLARTLKATSKSSLSSYIVAGHSMGTFLVMETMRSLVLAKDYQTLRKIDAVVLVSADLDIDVFRKQAGVVLAAGLPIFLVVSEDDRALSLSALLRGKKKRVGAVRTQEELGNIDVSIIDLTNVQDGGALAHSKIAESEAFLSYISALNEQGINVFQEHGQPGLFQIGVLFVQSGTNQLVAQ